MSMNLIALTWSEAYAAATQGIQRRLSNCYKGNEHGDGYDILRSDEWGDDIRGCLGELAVCKYLGVYWTGMEKTRAPDALCYEVRTTKYKTGCLRLNRTDDDNKPYILCIDMMPYFRLAGWIYGKDGKQEKYWTEKQAGRFAFWVPQADLLAIDSLPKMFSNGSSIHEN